MALKLNKLGIITVHNKSCYSLFFLFKECPITFFPAVKIIPAYFSFGYYISFVFSSRRGVRIWVWWSWTQQLALQDQVRTSPFLWYLEIDCWICKQMLKELLLVSHLAREPPRFRVKPWFWDRTSRISVYLSACAPYCSDRIWFSYGTKIRKARV